MADDVVYINIEDGMKRVMGNSKLFVKLLNKFKEDQSMNDLESTLAAGDLPKAQIAAHTLKGVSGNLSLVELNKQVLEQETQIKAGSVNPDQINIVKTVYAQTLVEVEKVITQYA
jgi:HPt (histidine-containing phosphotransfer) domain-containing protein